jgi:hypothetical protein
MNVWPCDGQCRFTVVPLRKQVQSMATNMRALKSLPGYLRSRFDYRREGLDVRPHQLIKVVIRRNLRTGSVAEFLGAPI